MLQFVTSLCNLNSQPSKVIRQPSPLLHSQLPSSEFIVFNFHRVFLQKKSPYYIMLFGSNDVQTDL